MLRRTLPFLLVLGLSLGWAAPAVAGDAQLYARILQDYIKNGGRLTTCNYTIAQLKQAKSVVPVDANQYSAPFVAALDDALAARAQGDCNSGKKTQSPVASQVAPPPPATGQTPPPSSTPTTTHAPSTQSGTPAVAQAPAQPTPAPTSEPTPAPAIVGNNDIALASHETQIVPDAPFPMLALAILLAALALVGAAISVVRWFAWEPAWADRFRHAAGEAGWRASSTFSEFADFVRLGR